MAILQGGTKTGNDSKRCLYWFATGTGGAYYLHLKTNMAVGNYFMGTIEAEGYNYGASAPVKATWCYYSPGWDPSTLYSVGYKNHYTGFTADLVYRSSDNYIVLRGYTSNIYYLGFVINSFTSSPIGFFDVNITASAIRSDTGNQY